MLKKWQILFLIAVSVTLVYFQSFRNDFVNLDDGYYVYNNGIIQSFSKSLLTEFVIGNYHPLTMISYAIEFYFGGLNPLVYHTTNILLHIINSIFVFYFLLLLTKSQNISFFASMLFAVHPMHVESVAWISARKDLLYTLFYLLSLIAYLKFTETKNKKFLGLTFLFFILSLLCKAMAGTLPFCLLLIDYFLSEKKFKFQSHLKNKIPFLIVVFLFGLLAIKAQSQMDAFGGNQLFRLTDKFLFATYGILIYLIKFIVPFNLNCYYEYPKIVHGSLPPQYFLSVPLLISLTVIFFVFFRKNKLVVFGILFFLLNVLLVSQIVTVGSCVLAERYTYLSYVGFCLIAGCLLEILLRKLSKYKKEIFVNAAAVVIIFSFLSYKRTMVWKNSESLWTDAIRKNTKSASAYFYRGIYYSNSKQFDKAIHDYDKSIVLEPHDYKFYQNRGMTNFDKGNYSSAINDFSLALKYRADLPNIIFMRAQCYEWIGDKQNALNDYRSLLSSKEFGSNADESIKRLTGKSVNN